MATMASNTVNRPTNVAQKEADINQKLQLYGIYNAFSNGKVPSNRQIDVALNSALASRALASPSAKLSAEGRELVKDLRDVIEQAKVLLLTKNEGNLLQDFIWQTQHIGGGNAALPNAPLDKDTAKQHGNQALDGLRTLGTLIVSNGQFRKLLSDATILIRNMAGDAAQTAANKINPSEDELNQLDKPAQDNTWHDVPQSGDLKSQAKGTFNKFKPVSRQDMKDAAGDATQNAHPDGSRNPEDIGGAAADEAQHGGDSGIDAQGGAMAGASSLANKAKDNFPDETKDKIRDTKNQTKDQTKGYLRNQMPQERRDQTIWRLKKMVVEIQGHQDYQQAIDTLLSLAEEYTGHGHNVAQQSIGTVKGAHTDNALTTAEADLKTLIERFANSTSSDDLFESINNMYRDADRDPELKKWFREMDQYVRKCLKETGYIMEDKATDEYNRLYDRGNFLLRDRYRDHTNRVMDEIKHLADQFDQDPQNTRFANSMNKLFNDLGNDENGKPTFKPHLIKDLTNVILPGVFESIRYVPVPRIEYTDHMMDAIVENLVIESDNLTPNLLEIGSDNLFRWGRKTVASKNKNKVMLNVSGVQMDLKDVSYYVKKKEGFPSVMDKGVMDIFMGGTGFSFKIAMETADEKMRQNFFKVNTIVVDVKNLNIKLKQSNHKLLFNLFKPLLFRVLRPVIQKVLEKVIKDKLNEFDGMAYSIYQEVNRAKETAKNDPEQAQNIYQQYVTAAQKKFAQGKQKSAEVAADKKANVAMTQYDSMFKDIKLPGGISTKATEYKELAMKGEKWESPIFGIGSAKESTNLPRVTPVSRKPHNAASGGIRGPQNLHEGESTFGSPEPRTTGPSYDQSANTGYGQTTGAEYGTATSGTGYDQTNGATGGFSSQVNQAFDNSASQDLSLKNNGGITNGNTSGSGTLLGMNNPVLSGRV
ncbi:hypothetical protein MMC32_004989 [Xylographa parallela]|nr:hypothetical protein [Xylographa parallela]